MIKSIALKSSKVVFAISMYFLYLEKTYQKLQKKLFTKTEIPNTIKTQFDYQLNKIPSNSAFRVPLFLTSQYSSEKQHAFVFYSSDQYFHIIY